MVPFFLPMLRAIDNGHWYLGEDYAFCERARQCGFKIMADTSIRLWHIGEYAYGWEDAGLERPRHDSFLFLIADGNGAAPQTPCLDAHGQTKVTATKYGHDGQYRQPAAR